MTRRDIRFDSNITRGRVESLLANLRSQPTGRRVLIDSKGGEFECFSIYGPPLKRIGFTSVSERVESAANVLYLLGNRRLALPDSHFFFHEVRAIINKYGAVTFATVEEALDREREISRKREGAEELLRQMRNAQEWGVSFICERTIIPKATLISLMRAEAKLSPREAVRYGIAHRIVSPDELYNC